MYILSLSSYYNIDAQFRNILHILLSPYFLFGMNDIFRVKLTMAMLKLCSGRDSTWRHEWNVWTKIKKKKLENNLAIKYLFTQNLLLANIVIGKEFDVMGKTLYWETRAMNSRLWSVIIFWMTLDKLFHFSKS